MQASGNGGRATTGAAATLPAGFSLDDDRTETHRGRESRVIAGLSDGLMATLRYGQGTFKHTGDNKSQDISFQTAVKKWAKDMGVKYKFTSPVTDSDGKITRGAWAELADETPQDVRERVEEFQAELQREAEKVTAKAGK